MAELSVGSQFAGCLIEAVAGRGGMGVVYRATQVGLGRTVALKVIAPEYAADQAFAERFGREARLAASIEHPNVIPVYAAGEVEGVLYLLMRFVDGTDLRALLSRSGRLAPDRAVTLLAPVAAALASSHRGGLVHRDVKPANVLVAPEEGATQMGTGEHVYLTDFGIARTTESTAGGATRPGTIVGTPDYMAPERLEHGVGDGRSDVYALGCVLFEALTGELPYPRDNAMAKALAHINAPVPSARAVASEVPVALDEVVARALAKLPEDRFQTATELRDAMVAAIASDPPEPLERRLSGPGDGLSTTRPEGEVPAEALVPMPGDGPVTADTRRGTGPVRRGVRRVPAALLALGTVALGALVALIATGVIGGDLPVLPTGPPATTEAQTLTFEEPGARALPAIAVGEEPLAGALGSGLWVAVEGAAVVVSPDAPELPPTAVALAGRPAAVAVGDKDVWVADIEGGTVARVGRSSQAPVGNPIEVGTEPAAIAIGGGSVWVANRADSTVTRIDERTGEQAGEPIEVDRDPAAIAYDTTGVWVTSAVDGTVTRIDPRNGEAGTPIQVGGIPLGIDAKFGAVWVSDSAGGTVTEIDPRRERIRGRPLEVGPDPRGVAIARDAVWVAITGSNEVVLLDASGPAVRDRLAVGEQPVAVAVGERYTWVVNRGSGSVTPIRP